jgi:hypothetical protein
MGKFEAELNLLDTCAKLRKQLMFPISEGDGG